jgi:NAD kinase
VLPAGTRLRLEPTVEPDADPVVTFDGQYGVQLVAGDLIEIARAPRVLTFMRTSTRTHFRMLREKLKWGNV